MEEVASEGNLNFGVKATPVMLSEYNAVVKTAIFEHLGHGFNTNIMGNGPADDIDEDEVMDFVNRLLKENNAIIAGGFLLANINPTENNNQIIDIDCYVPARNLVTFNKTMVKLTDADEFKSHQATMYCSSFLRKNGIRSVQGLYKSRGDHVHSKDHVMDIMAVRNSRSPIDVVQNFDLTFCQVWYDGENVWATHPNHIKEKRGILQKDYVPVFLKGNDFLRNRIRKYSRRGYSITLDSYQGSAVVSGSQGECVRVTKDDNYYKKWVTRILLHVILTGTYKSENARYYFTNEFNLDILDHMPTFRRGPLVPYQRIERTQKRLHPDQMRKLNPLDGYDTDDYDISNRDTFNTELLNKYAPNIPDTFRNGWIALPDEVKFWNCINHMKVMLYSLNIYKNPFRLGYNLDGGLERRRIEGEIRDLYNFLIPNNNSASNFTEYAIALLQNTRRSGDDALTLDSDVEVFDLHNHSLDDAISVAGLKIHLNPLINQRDKNALPCYVGRCPWTLTLDEIRPIVDADYYIRFTEPIPEPLPPPSPLLGNGRLWTTPDDAANERLDLLTIIRDTPSDAPGWRNIYHHIMCPFCLGYISRLEGCTYVSHPNIERLPYAFMPFCRPQNVIGLIKDKYTNSPQIEVCAECGRPCTNHRHFDLNDPPDFAPQVLTPAGNPDYSRCGGGGRREGIARIIGVRNTVIDNPDMELGDLRVIAALAAEAAASDEAILARADIILAKDSQDRVEANMDMTQPVGGSRVGKVCTHGYESYSKKIKMSRKARKSKKGTRKN